MKSVSCSARLGLILAQLLGSASLLLLLLFLFMGSFQFFALGSGHISSLVFDTVLCLVFFLQHSLMIRQTFRRRLGRFVIEQYHGLVFGISSSIALILCLVLWQRIETPVIELNGALKYALHGIFILSLAGFVWGKQSLGTFDTFGTKQALAHVHGAPLEDSRIVIKGPYRWVRHPFYFFSIILFWACPVITPDRLLFNILWTAWVVLGAKLEERDLVSRFGELYRRYQKEVPMIIPWRWPG